MSPPMRTFAVLNSAVVVTVIAVPTRPSSTVMISLLPPARMLSLVLFATRVVDALPMRASMVLVIIVSAPVRFLSLMLLSHLAIRFIIVIDPSPLQAAVVIVVFIPLCITTKAPKSVLRLRPLLSSERSIMAVCLFDDVLQESGIRFRSIRCWPRLFKIEGLS